MTAKQAAPKGLSFSFAGIPVRVTPAFFIVTLMLGYRPDHTELMALWLVVSFACIFVHELGHAAFARAFGHTVRIELHGFGGTTHHRPAEDGKRLSAPREALVLLMGPVAGLLLGALAWPLQGLLAEDSPQEHVLAAYAVRWVLWITWGYGLLNFVPILPLDGGQLARVLVKARFPKREHLLMALIEGGAAILLIVAAFFFRQPSAWFLAIWLILARRGAFLNAMKEVVDERYRRELTAFDKECIQVGTFAARIEMGEALLPKLTSDRHRAHVVSALAFAYSGAKRWPEAKAALEKLPKGFTPDRTVHALILQATGDPEHAGELVKGTRLEGTALGHKIMVQGLSQKGAHEEAVALARSRLTDHSDYHALEAALFLAGKIQESLEVSERMFADTPCTESSYNAACSCARLGRLEEAIGWLTRSVDMGYANSTHAQSDSDLDPLRDRQDFAELLRRMGENALKASAATGEKWIIR